MSLRLALVFEPDGDKKQCTACEYWSESALAADACFGLPYCGDSHAISVGPTLDLTFGIRTATLSGNVAFNFFTRKHHCRCCGLIYCNKCSTRRIEVPHVIPSTFVLHQTRTGLGQARVVAVQHPRATTPSS